GPSETPPSSPPSPAPPSPLVAGALSSPPHAAPRKSAAPNVRPASFDEKVTRTIAYNLRRHGDLVPHTENYGFERARLGDHPSRNARGGWGGRRLRPLVELHVSRRRRA